LLCLWVVLVNSLKVVFSPVFWHILNFGVFVTCHHSIAFFLPPIPFFYLAILLFFTFNFFAFFGKIYFLLNPPLFLSNLFFNHLFQAKEDALKAKQDDRAKAMGKK
jgi:hypothetical protein